MFIHPIKKIPKRIVRLGIYLLRKHERDIFKIVSNRMAGLLTFGSIYSPRLPGPDVLRTSGVIR